MIWLVVKGGVYIVCGNRVLRLEVFILREVVVFFRFVLGYRVLLVFGAVWVDSVFFV